MEAIVMIPNLKIHTGAGLGYAPTGFVTGEGTFKIDEVKKGAVNSVGTMGPWGRLASGDGWICLATEDVKIM